MFDEVAHDDWADPLVTARTVGQRLMEALDAGWGDSKIEAVEEFRLRRAHDPLLLAVTAAVLDPDGGRARAALRSVLDELHDSTWAVELGDRVARYAAVGVLSLGRNTVAVLEAAAAAGGRLEEVHTDSRAVARGLEYLLLEVVAGAPENAAALLVPAVAAFGSRVWTTNRAADAALRASLRTTPVLVVVHPLAQLSQRNRAAFRPPAHLIDVEI